jgi:hypothetical protein
MSLSNLLNVPKTKEDWDVFSLSHRIHHADISRAVLINTSGATQLFEYQLDPIPREALEEWIARNQQAHNDMNAALNLESQDLEDADFKDPQKLRDWIYNHWQEHSAAAQALGI